VSPRNGTIAVLFDTDGTLITTGGAGAAASRLAFDEIYGILADIGAFTDAGMTDRRRSRAVRPGAPARSRRPGDPRAAAGGIEADIWKIEGLDRREDCERVSGQARAGGRHGVACIVLGRGGDEARVVHWLEEGAGVPGYIGFAVGRTFWWDELSAFFAGRLDRDEAARRVAHNYSRLIGTYVRAERNSR
jgi:beta-phosphoglucomutase-like phosphatase (HAD superfamily)